MSLAASIETERQVAYYRKLIQEKPELLIQTNPKLTDYIPNVPTPKQAVFLLLHHQEAMFGGAAGGGKTDALLMTALQYVDVPNYAALILRRTYGQLTKADSILDRCHSWLRNTDASWEAQNNRYTFPTGATVQFGYLQYFKDVYQYDGPAFQTIIFDELTQFPEECYRFLFSRLRRNIGMGAVPLRMRSATNPGGIGHLWVKERFIKMKKKLKDRFFIQALLSDNPHLDIEAYRLSLAQLDPITRKQREEGDWDIQREGMIFRREWFKEILPKGPTEARRVRYWDLAATAPKPGKNPDYTVGTLLSRDRPGKFYIEDVRRFRCEPADVESFIVQTARFDGRSVKIRIEQEPGASGKSLVHSYIRLLPGYDVQGIPSSGSKLSRWMPVAAQVQAGNVAIVDGPWIHDWYEEICNLGMSANEHDDQADSLAGAFNVHIEEPPVLFGVTRLSPDRAR